jgi:hypothetical protein
VVWFPVCTAIYALPPLLKIPLFSLALTFWVLIFAYITSRRNEGAPPNEESFALAATE